MNMENMVCLLLKRDLYASPNLTSDLDVKTV